MKAVRVHTFGGIDAMAYEDAPMPVPGPGQVLVRVAAAGVGPWDAWVRSGKSVLPQPLPLTLGADLCGTVQAVGPDVPLLQPGTVVFGVTNPRFVGAYADYALAEAAMIAVKPDTLSSVEAGSAPVVACTAHQMLFEEGNLLPSNTVVVLGGGGNVGGYAVQLAVLAGANVVATGRSGDLDRIRALGAAEVIRGDRPPPPKLSGCADLVVDTVGGAALAEAFELVRPGGMILSAVGEPDQKLASRRGVRSRFVLVAVTAGKLIRLATLFDEGRLKASVARTLRLSEAREAHRLMDGGAPPGKLVLVPDSPDSSGESH